MPKKITEVSLAASLAPTDNPTFYVEKGGVFRRVTLGQLIDCIKDDIDVGGELTEAAKQALLDCFEHVAWVDDQGQTYYDALHDALYPTPTSITAVFTQGGATIYDTQTLNDLRQYLVVTAVFDDGTEKAVSNYTLSGTLTAGTSTITVTYQGLTTTFNVTVTHNAARLTAVYTQSGTVYTTDTLDSLKTDLVVTYYATQQSQGVVLSDNDYTLSGTLTEGTSTITVTYDTVSTSFTVTVTADPAYITAVYTQTGTVYVNDSVDSLKTDLVVTYFANSHSAGVVLTDSDYTLSGTLTVGTSTVIVSYNGFTTTFTVTVTSRRNPALPNTYEQVEYITPNGTKYIDTGILSQVPFVANVTGKWSNNDVTIAGGQSGGTDRFYICGFLIYQGTTNRFANRYGNTDWFFDTGSVPTFDTLYDVESGIISESGGAKAYISYDNSYAEHTVAVPTTGKEIDIFRNPVDSGIAQDGVAKIYTVKFYAGSGGTKLFEGVPCYRKSDNVSGLYDTVSETFLPGTGTGNFGIGSIVY